jgi:hypothetical protein
MKRKGKIAEAGATGYILLWLLGIHPDSDFVAYLLAARVHMRLGSK